MENKLGIIFCGILFIFLIVTYSTSAENCIGELCPNNNSQIDENINCENFYWVENYIKNNLSNSINRDQMNFINLLKNANYNMQEELNICNKTTTNYRGLTILFGMIIFILIIYLTVYRLFFYYKNNERR